jgi:hypothetical protein
VDQFQFNQFVHVFWIGRIKCQVNYFPFFLATEDTEDTEKVSREDTLRDAKKSSFFFSHEGTRSYTKKKKNIKKVLATEDTEEKKIRSEEEKK